MNRSNRPRPGLLLPPPDERPEDTPIPDPGNPSAEIIPLRWVVGPSDSADRAPEKTVPATIPGAVQLDWARCCGWPDPWLGLEVRRYRGLEDFFWHYRSEIPALPQGGDLRLHLTALGIDYRFSIRLAGRALVEQEGMFSPVGLDLTAAGARPGDALEIVVHPAPKSGNNLRTNRQFDRSVKPGVSYGWDFHPHLTVLGVWRDLRLELRPPIDLRSLAVHTEVSAESGVARFSCEIGAFGAEGETISLELCDPAGKLAWRGETRVAGPLTLATGEVASPLLWHPWTEGEPNLYSLTARIGEQRLERRCGFRSVRLVTNEGAGHKPDGGTRPYAAMTLEVNGQRLFGRGINWVAPDVFYGATPDSRYREQVKMLRDCNINLVRLWGGAPAPGSEAFFDACDEAGIMVWQEFPLAGVHYSEESPYLAVLDREARAIIRRIRQHPCLAIWCGGNEQIIWGRNSDYAPAFRVLDRACLELDPFTPYFPSSPHFGVNHGPYRYDGMWGFLGLERTANAEFGVPGMADADSLRRIIPAEELFPPRPGGAWTLHKGQEAMGPQGWVQQDQIGRALGPSVDLEELAEKSRRLQAAGLKFAYEETRRQWPFNSMALAWVFNEPWPCAANNSIVAWPSEPKPAYFAVRDALRDQLASARYFRPIYRPGERFEAELWLLNDGGAQLPAGSLLATLCQDTAALAEAEWAFPEVAPRSNLKGPVFAATLPAAFEGALRLELHVAGRPELSSRYEIFVRADAALAGDGARFDHESRPGAIGVPAP